MRLKMFFVCLAILALVTGGCKDDSNPAAAGGGSTTFTGIMAGTGVSGSISITIPTPKRAYPSTAAEGDTLVVTGVLKINGGATISLTGFLVVETGELSLTGGGYTFDGFLDMGSVTGTFTYSGGTGYFSAEQGSSSTVKTYCGSYQDNAPGTESGTFNMIINGTSIVVIVFPDGSGGNSFVGEGELIGGTQIVIYNPEVPSVPAATGTLNTATNTISGTYLGDPGGTWSGSACN
jgi:hypothetical protein